MCERACGSVFRVIFHAENLIKKINLWTFDSRRDKNRDGQQHLPLSPSLCPLLWLSLLRVLKLHADFDRWHSRCCRLLLQLGNDNFNWNGACNMRAYVCVSCLGLGPIAGQRRTVCGKLVPCVPHELQVSAINLFQHEFNSHLVCASVRSSSAVPKETLRNIYCKNFVVTLSKYGHFI